MIFVCYTKLMNKSILLRDQLHKKCYGAFFLYYNFIFCFCSLFKMREPVMTNRSMSLNAMLGENINNTISEEFLDKIPQADRTLVENLMLVAQAEIESLNLTTALVFGGCVFPPVSLGPTGDCPCRD